ncbi:hypothetical protein [Catenulispora subtropica]|uniref:hypothetical protein n=1 Tax=Catenulispora subtropica TaxID=450798 RepID=UPI0031D4C239
MDPAVSLDPVPDTGPVPDPGLAPAPVSDPVPAPVPVPDPDPDPGLAPVPVPDPDRDPEAGPDLAEAEQEAAAPAVAGWVGLVFLCGGLAVVPWTAYLALTLPLSSESGHYRVAWVGFDLLLAFTLLHVGWIAAGGPTRNDRVELPATAAGTLLLVDAWFDTTTAAGGGALLEAVLFAVLGELPMAGVCFWIAHHAEEIRERRLRLLPRLERLGRR